jgi:signal transduction histidine kinase
MRHGSRPRGDLRASGTRAAIALMAAGALIVVAVTWQAWEAERSRAAAVARLAADYSAVGAWSFHRFANASLQSGFEHVLHPAHPSEDGPRGPQGAGALLAAHGGHHPACSFGGTERIRGALHFRLGREAEAEVAGVLPADLPRALLMDTLAGLARASYQRGWMSALTVVRTASSLRPVGYFVRVLDRDTLVWAVPFELDALRTLLQLAASANDLLPPSLTGPMASAEFLALGAWLPDGTAVWQSRPESGSFPIGPTVPLEARWGGLRLSAATLPEAAPRLAIGGLPPSRLPVTAGLLLLTTGLLVAVVAQLRRVHELARLRSDFVSSVSHELRTPLALQRVSIDMLRLGRARDAAVRERALANVDREATRLTHLVDNLLRFTRSEAGAAHVRLEPVALAPLVVGTVEGFRALLDPADSVIHATVDDDVVALVDAEAIRRVLLNLLENAVKYGRRGQTVSVRVARDGARALIAVADEGRGVAASERDLIWEPFRRGAGAVGGATAGSGIGLAVVRDIVAAHGGDACIADAPGGGARFEVRVPLAPDTSASRPFADRSASVHV